MVTYAVVGNRLEITSVGPTADAEFAIQLASIRADASVPPGAALLLDRRLRGTEGASSLNTQARVDVLFDVLRPRLAPHCAVVTSSDNEDLMLSSFIRVFAMAHRVTVRLFHDIDEARQWLDGCSRASRLVAAARPASPSHAASHKADS